MPDPDRIRMPCPSCGHILKIRREYVGKVGTCKQCNHNFTIRVPDDRALTPEGTDLPVPASDLSMEFWGGPPAQGGPRPTSSPADAVRNLEVDRDRLAGRVGRLSAELAKAQASKQTVETDLAGTRAERDTLLELVDRLSAELSEAHATLEATETELSTLRGERDQLKDAHGHAERLGHEIQDLRSRHAEELARVQEEARGGWEAERQGVVEEWTARWEQERDRAARHEGETEELRGHLDTERDRLKDAHGHAERLGREVQDLRSRHAEELDRHKADAKEGWEAERQGVVAEWMERWEQERDRASRHEGEAEELRGRLGSSQAQFESERDRLQRDHEDTRAEVDRLLADLELRGQELAREREGREADARSWDERAAAIRQEWEGERGDWTAERDRHQTSAEAAAASGQRIAELEGLHRDAAGRARELEEQHGRKASALDAMESDLKALRARVAEMSDQLQQAETFKAELIRLLENLGIRVPG